MVQRVIARGRSVRFPGSNTAIGMEYHQITLERRTEDVEKKKVEKEEEARTRFCISVCMCLCLIVCTFVVVRARARACVYV